MIPNPSQNLRRSRTPVFLAGAAIAAAAVAVYANSLSGPFVFDDLPTIIDNPTIRHLRDAGSVLSPPSGGYTVSGRPVLNLSLAINYAISGTNVWSYHATNLLIHALAGLTLFGIMRRTLRSMGFQPMLKNEHGLEAHATSIAFAVALIWTVHPLQTESVTYVIQRAESLMGLFYLLTLHCFVRSVDAAARRVPGDTRRAAASTFKSPSCWAGLSVAACLLGMATKEVMVSAPAMVLLYDRTFLAGTFGEAWRRRRRYYLGLALTWIPLGYLSLHTHSRGATVGMNLGMSPMAYWLTQFHAITHYLGLVFWPSPLVLDYGTHLVQSAGSVLPSLALTAALVAGTLWALGAKNRNWRAVGFAGVFFFAILAPTSLVPVIVQVMAEHRMYLALAPVVAVTVAGGCRRLETAFPPGGKSGSSMRFFLPLCLVAAAGLGVAAARRNEDYRTALALWRTTAAESPGNPRAQCNLGLALADAGDNSAAVKHYLEALKLKPGYPEAHNDLGIALSVTGRWSESILEYREAVWLDPGFAKAYYNLGNAMLHVGNPAGAVASYETARRLGADSLDVAYNLGVAHNDLGVILAGMGRFPEAIAEYHQALRLKPGLAKAHNDLGTALASTGSLGEATAQFQEALRLDPDFYLARLNLGHALMLAGQTDQARAQFEQARRLAPHEPQSQP